jgi:hypothetical protein
VIVDGAVLPTSDGAGPVVPPPTRAARGFELAGNGAVVVGGERWVVEVQALGCSRSGVPTGDVGPEDESSLACI